jgi:serine protease Do
MHLDRAIQSERGLIEPTDITGIFGDSMNSVRKSLAVALLGGGAVGGLLVGAGIVREYAFAQAEQKVEASREQLSTVTDLSTVFREVGKAVEPSVVNITVHKTVKGVRRDLPFDDDLLKRFFPDRFKDQPDDNGGENGNNDAPDPNAPDDSAEQVGTGSGVIMEVNGKYGAGGATELLVTLSDGRQIENAKVLGTDPKSDLAVVKIEADHLIPARWGDSSTLEKGDWILAFGSPFGYVGSMTHGIVSALDRQAGILGSQGYEDFIQVDAPINPGNSGGPLVNIHGDVVGINTAIASRSGGFQGIGFAIPSNEAKFVYAALKEKGHVTRGWLGVSISDVSKDLPKAQSFGYTGSTGVLVEQTFPNTPATGKLQPGDIIEQINGKDVGSVLALRNSVAANPPGAAMTFKVFRDGKESDVEITLGEQPADLVAFGRGAAPGEAAAEPASSAEALGMKLVTPDDQAVTQYNLSEKEGALVTSVKPRSPADKAGIRPGDLITHVAGQVVTNAKQAGDAIGKQDPAKGIRFYVTSADGSRFVFVEPEKQ